MSGKKTTHVYSTEWKCLLGVYSELPEDARKRYDEKLDKLETKVDDPYATMPLGAQSGASGLWMMSSRELWPKLEYPLPRQYAQSLHEGSVEGIQKYGRL